MRKAVYKVAIIGCGRVGIEEKNYKGAVKPGSHGASWLQTKGAKLVAFVESDSLRREIAKKYFPNIPMYAKATDMYLKEKPDVVSIATPNATHRDTVLQAAEWGVGAILCEKPIALSISDAKEMIAACRRKKIKLYVNHTRRFDPLLNRFAKKVKQGLLGVLYQANGYYYNGLMTNGTHMVDLIRMFLGEPSSVRGSINRTTSWNQSDMNYDATLSFRGKYFLGLHSLSKNYGHFGLEIFGEKGRLEIDNLGYRVRFSKKVANRNFRGYFELAKPIEEGGPRSMMVQATRAVIRDIQGKLVDISTGEDGLKALQILEAIKRSAESDKSINIK